MSEIWRLHSCTYIYKSFRGVHVHSFLARKVSSCNSHSSYFISLFFSLPLAFQNAQRLGASQVTQPLTTPVVSVATPSLLTPFSMPTAYNTGESDVTAGLHTNEWMCSAALVYTTKRCLQICHLNKIKAMAHLSLLLAFFHSFALNILPFPISHLSFEASFINRVYFEHEMKKKIIYIEYRCYIIRTTELCK